MTKIYDTVYLESSCNMDTILNKILTKKEITIKDHIKFRTIFDVISAIFTDENHVSILKGHYMVNQTQQVWFPNIVSEEQKATKMTKAGYANYLSHEWDQIYQFTATKDIAKRKKLTQWYLDNKIELITFAKINEKTKGIGYHFLGVFQFDKFSDDTYQTMIFKKIADSYKLHNK